LRGRQRNQRGRQRKAAPMFKDTVFVDFLGLSQKHSEKRLQRGILDNMKDFILEFGKDFLFVDKEFSLQVGNSTFKIEESRRNTK
jgi:predicted nuclease of restriction endonuclease-like (RecB) superfamily